MRAPLSHVDVGPAFRFLHILTGLVNSSDATAYYYFDPNTVSDETVNTFKHLFDRVEIEETGGDST